jgi:hypothetical protein
LSPSEPTRSLFPLSNPRVEGALVPLVPVFISTSPAFGAYTPREGGICGVKPPEAWHCPCRNSWGFPLPRTTATLYLHPAGLKLSHRHRVYL